MAKPKGGRNKSQTWLTFLRNHLPVPWAMDFFTVPTLRLQTLYIFVILNHSRRQVVHFAVTAHPTMALGDPATAGSDAFWSTTYLSVP